MREEMTTSFNGPPLANHSPGRETRSSRVIVFAVPRVCRGSERRDRNLPVRSPPAARVAAAGALLVLDWFGDVDPASYRYDAFRRPGLAQSRFPGHRRTRRN